ncbi:MAG: hypothetical protein ACD_41C00156G0005 [uncultured bacterium]|nr:MAG: hypothetical protein ACD_41C00156G0005 [uncultured bacterium]HBY73737.1 hypothetical protein [Candidatus Kerfeldbacteria bacterium]
MRKPIIGLEEEVKIFIPETKTFIRRKAKIDTGARTTAIDVSVAKRIGLLPVYTSFVRLMPKLDITKKNFQHVREHVSQHITPKLKKQIPGLYDIRVIPATNGISVRPYVRLHLHLRGKHIPTIASIVDRKILLYSVLVGKKDLAGFLIDPTKHVYKEA